MAAMATGSELSRIDQTIMRYAASRSANEISAMLGGTISPERVQEQGKKLLSDRNWLKMAEREMILIYQFEEIIADLEEQRASGSYEYLDAHLRALKDLGGRLDKLRSANQIDLETYDMNVAREMTRVYDIALGYMKGALRGEIDEEIWDSTAADALRHAAQEVSKKAVAE